MRETGKWIHLLVLTAFFVSTAPFASHAMMSRSAMAKTATPDNMPDPFDYTTHHHQADELPQQQPDDGTDLQQCECLAASCYNTVIPDIYCSVVSAYRTSTDFPIVDTHTHSAHVIRLERPPCGWSLRCIEAQDR